MKAIRSRKGLAEAARASARAALAFVMTVALCIPDAGLAFASDGGNDEGAKTVDKGTAAGTGTKAEGLAQLTRGASSAMDAENSAGDGSSTSDSAASGADAQDGADQSNGEGYAYRVMVPSGFELRDGDTAIADDGTIALLGFADEQAAKEALSWYGAHADFAVYDGSVAKADDTTASPDATDATDAQSPVTEDENPVKTVADAKANDGDGKDADTKDAKDADADGQHGLIALVDTGAKKGANVESAETVLGGTTDDDNGHGTQMAADMASVDQNCRIASIKALDADGNGTVSSVYAAIELAIKDGASVVNLSMSAKCVDGNPVLQKAVDDAAKAGALVVAASGNDGADAKDYIPASLTGVAAIGACDANGKRLDTSNYGETVAAFVQGESTSHAAAKTSAWAAANLDADGLKSGAKAIEEAVGNGFFFDGEGAHDGDGSDNEAGTDEITGENEGTQVEGAGESEQTSNIEGSQGEGDNSEQEVKRQELQALNPDYGQAEEYSLQRLTAAAGSLLPSKFRGAAPDGYTRQVFDYTGGVQSFTAPATGMYTVTCVGAQGGSFWATHSGTTYWGRGGKGGLTTGQIKLNKGQTVYIAVGQHTGFWNGGWNGGGNGNGTGTPSNENTYAGGGGGATSVTTTNRGELKNFASYKSEVLMVAGGGGGCGETDHVEPYNITGFTACDGGGGGGLVGQAGQSVNFGYSTVSSYPDILNGMGSGGTQDHAGSLIQKGKDSGQDAGGFGYGGNATALYDTGQTRYYAGGGGGGWYGGGGGDWYSQSTHSFSGGGGGGSGYLASSIVNGSTTASVQGGNGHGWCSITWKTVALNEEREDQNAMLENDRSYTWYNKYNGYQFVLDNTNGSDTSVNKTTIASRGGSYPSADTTGTNKSHLWKIRYGTVGIDGDKRWNGWYFLPNNGDGTHPMASWSSPYKDTWSNTYNRLVLLNGNAFQESWLNYDTSSSSIGAYGDGVPNLRYGDTTLWTLNPVGDGDFLVQNSLGTYLSIDGDAPFSAGQNVQTWHFANGEDFYWHPVCADTIDKIAKPVVRGTIATGSTLTTDIKINGSNPQFTWYRTDGTKLGTGRTYKLTATDVSQGVKVTATDANKIYLGSSTVGSNALTVNPNGGTFNGSSAKSTVAGPSGTTTTLSSPTRTGYKFAGWALSGAGSMSGTTYTYGAGDGTLTAQWTPVTYSISYNLAGGTASGNPTSYTIESAAISLKAPTRVGYTFAGWTGSNGTAPQKSVTIPKGSTGNKSYIANWTVNSYTVTYEDWFVDASNNRKVKLGSSTASKAFGTKVAGSDLGTDTTNGKYYYAYQYAGSTSATVGTSGATAYRYFTSTADINFWEPKGETQTGGTFSVSYDGGKTWTTGAGNEPKYTGFHYGDTVWIKDIKPIEGYDFKSVTLNSQSGSAITPENGIYKMTVSPTATNGLQSININTSYHSYSISYNLNGGSISGQETSYTIGDSAFTLPTPTRAGYTFAGWTGSNGTTAQKTVTVGNGSTGNKSYTANWTANTYKVTYNANGGSGTMANSTATYDASFNTTKNAFTRPGYTFNGWNEKADGTGTAWGLGSNGVYENGNGAHPWKWAYTHDLTLYAQWTPNTYQVTYNGNGSTSGMTASTKVTFGQSWTTATNAFLKTGYSFKSWNSQADGKGTPYSQAAARAAYSIVGNLPLYAIWTVNTYSLTVNPNGGSWNGSTSSSTVSQNYGTTKSIAAPTRSGYTFVGWAQTGAGTLADSTSDNAFTDNKWTSGTGSYDNTGSGAVSISTEAVSADNPLKSVTGHEGVFKNSGAKTTSPQLGGWHLVTQTRANSRHIVTFVANVPKGYFLHYANNSIGSGGYTRWLTPNIGMGTFQTYAYEVYAGSSGTFMDSGYVYLSADKTKTWEKGAGSATGAVTAKVATYGYTDVTAGTTKTYTYGASNGTLTALWAPNKHKATLDNQGATSAGTTAYWWFYNTASTYNGNQAWYYSDEQTIGVLGAASKTYPNYQIDVPSKNGYTFGGYYTGKNGTGTQYVNAAGACVNSLYQKDSDVTLYANWVPNTYTVTYNGNGANSGTTSSTSVTFGQSWSAASNAFLKTGYTFKYWYDNANGTNGTYYTANAKQAAWNRLSNMPLYAIWAANSYTIAFDPNAPYGEYEGSTASEAMTYDVSKALTANGYTYAGYDFTGWNTKKDGSGAKYADKQSVKNLATSGTVTLYAQWKPKTYSIVYNANNGAGTMANGSITEGQSATLTGNAFSRTGYTFTGWNTKADGSGISYSDKQTVKDVTGELFTNAQQNGIGWGSLTANASGAPDTSIKTYAKQTARDATISGSFMTVGKTYKITGLSVADSTAQSKATIGFGFYNKTTNKYYDWRGGSYLDTTTSKWARTAFTYTNNDSNVGIYPWLQVSGWPTDSSSYNGSNGIGGWYRTQLSVRDMTQTSTTLYAQWKPVNYSISYNLGGGSMSGQKTSYTVTDAAYTLPTPTRTGYTFAGWTGSNGTTPQTSVTIAQGSTGNKTYTANWTINKYYLDVNGVINGKGFDGLREDNPYTSAVVGTFDVTVNGTTVSKSVSDFYKNFDYGSSYEIQNVTPKPGWVYKGVTTNSSPLKGTMGTGNKSVQLVFDGVPYKVAFDGNGATSGSTAGMDMTYGVYKTLTKNGFSRTGYTFAGWNTKADGTGTSYADASSVRGLTTTSGATVTLYAQWKPINYNVHFDGNLNTSGTMADQSMTYGTLAPLTKNAYGRTYTVTLDGNGGTVSTGTLTSAYSFNGWATTASGAVVYADGAQVKNLTPTAGATVNLYANWAAKSVTLPTPTRTGYTFKGWATSADATSGTTGTYTPTGNVKLYATWEKTVYKNTVSHWATGFKNGEGNDSSKTIFNIANDTFSGTYGDSITLDQAKNTKTPNGFETTTYVGYNNPSDNAWVTKTKPYTMTQPAQAMNFSYQYAPITYTITYNMDGGTNAATNPKSYNVLYGVTFAAPTKTGYTFTGWTDAKGKAITGVNPGANATFTSASDLYTKLAARTTGNVTANAHWKANNYTVKFDANGGTGTMANEGMTFDAEKTLTANSYSRTGYSFTGWNTKPDGSGTTYRDGQSVKNFTSQNGANVTLYAQWKANEYTLTIDPNGGFIGGSDKATALSPKLVFGKGNWHVISSELPKRTGYKLVGFYDAKTGGDQVFDANGLAVKGDYWTDAGSKGSYQHPADLTVYARWEAVPETMPQSGSYEMLVPVIAAACVAAAIGVRSVKWKKSEKRATEDK